MTTPRFSVVIPCHRAAATIAMAVRSVLTQTEADLELIVVDDGSPDDSAALAVAAADGDKRLLLLRQPNAGVAAARNAGIARARGALIAFLDADDRWEETALAHHEAAFGADPRLGVSFGLVRFYDPAMRTPGRLSATTGPIGLADALGENPVCTASNMVVRRAVIEAAGGFDVALRHAEDQEWLARILATTDWRVVGLPVELVHYRTSVGGLSTALNQMEAGWLAMMESLARRAPARVAAARPRAEALFRRYLARRALRTGQPGALSHLARALAASPTALVTHDARRSLLTLAGALAAAILPQRLVCNLVSR
jgi:hypothetical protein